MLLLLNCGGMDYLFPKDFLWGSSTAAYQVEGGNQGSDWWAVEGQIEKKIRDSGGADHYHRFKGDYALASSLGLNAQRLSLEWSRIEPAEDVFDEREIGHYKEVLRFLKDRKVKVFLTLHHFSNPLWFEAKGGWLNVRDSRRLFCRYVEVCVKEFSPLIDAVITINEPNLYSGMYPLKLYLGSGGRVPFFTAVKTFFDLISVHMAAYKTIKKLNGAIPVGFSGNFPLIDPFDRSLPSKFAARLGRYFSRHQLYWFFKNYADFVGVNYYHHLRAKINLLDPRNFYQLYNGQAVQFSHGWGGSRLKLDLRQENQGSGFCDLGWEIFPSGLLGILDYLKSCGKPIYITENGIADAGDSRRENYIKSHLGCLAQAIEGGADVRGYFYWSLIDNFEWFQGYAPRFGLIEVDYQTKERKIRPSALRFAEICRANALVI